MRVRARGCIPATVAKGAVALWSAIALHVHYSTASVCIETHRNAEGAIDIPQREIGRAFD
jgi:hypothetical protein